MPRKMTQSVAKKKKPVSTVTKVESKPGITFRSRTPEDDGYIVHLTEEQLGSIHQQAFGEPFPREQFMNYIQSGAPTTVVLEGDKRIGYYSYLVGQDGKMHISALVLENSHQSSGIGTLVMKHVEEHARSTGVHTLEVYVQDANPKSIEFTRKLGFVEVFRPLPHTICFQKRIQTEVPPQTQAMQAFAQFVGYYPYHR